MRLTIDVAMRTDKGLVREQNEDAVGGDPTEGLIILADGMGGANAGEVASTLAIDLLVSQLIGDEETDEKRHGAGELLEAMAGVNQAILELSQQVPEYRGMGTTLVVGLFGASSLIYAHVGDSRLYRLRDGVLECLTSDHTLIQEIVNEGDFSSVEEARLAGVPSNVLTRAFGTEPSVPVDIAETDLQAQDLYLFCSDGLTSMVGDLEIQGIVSKQHDDLMEANDELIELACRMGGIDNISVILARVIDSDEE